MPKKIVGKSKLSKRAGATPEIAGGDMVPALTPNMRPYKPLYRRILDFCSSLWSRLRQYLTFDSLLGRFYTKLQ
ncbi:MAG: hypothetical protein L7F77_08785 [Candidatus Magnetominusculus sp. LBB02]|nr:hypothetical protein [Candidatus Magnetominusculus sp. LBB02]